ncbi:MAG TPA: nucleotide pyrophosphohydrolase [Candidatus Babeliales bacterium]|nr:nucleotide pyrophosphohydrolase [Candidatus Babeliales bacterium]
MDDTIKALTKRIIGIRDARDWKQFHNPKDVALSLVLEATEVLELFQWKNNHHLEEFILQNKAKIAEELSDVLCWVLLMSHDLSIDLPYAFEEKMKKNEAKYPIEKARGVSKKYTEL